MRWARRLCHAAQLGERPFGLCVSNVSLSEGEITLDFIQKNGAVDERVVFGYKSPTEETWPLASGGMIMRTPSRLSLQGGWRKLVGIGHKNNLTSGRTHKLEDKDRGAERLLEVDGVRAFDHHLPFPAPYGQVGLFAWGESGATFSEVRTSKEVEQVVILVHGIRTYAEWQSTLKKEFSRVGIPVMPTNYGYSMSLDF